MFYAYVLRSLSTGNLYKGSTEDLEARMKAHNEGMSRYTRGRGPWELVYVEEFSTRSEAVRRERFFKSGAGRNWLKEKLGESG